jgi:hypothetical protein
LTARQARFVVERWGKSKKHAKQRKSLFLREKLGHRFLPLTRPGAGIYICESEIVKRQVLYVQGELEEKRQRQSCRRQTRTAALRRRNATVLCAISGA